MPSNLPTPDQRVPLSLWVLLWSPFRLLLARVRAWGDE
jgi:hypothetical protein